MDAIKLWKRYKKYLCKCPGLNLSVDISRMAFADRFLNDMEPAMQKAFADMAALEGGAIANPDENRMVGHYWLRAPQTAPNDQIATTIRDTIAEVQRFADEVHRKAIVPPTAPRFTDVLLIGIGGSALGPQLVADALGRRGGKRDKMAIHYFDNTDPDGMIRTLADIGARLKSTLVLVLSKSGGTPETRNGMVLAQNAFNEKGLEFAKQAVAITGEGSKLDQLAVSEGWLKRFPMWDWVGGRTSVMATVGLVPMALQGINISQFLEGAAKMDELTRVPHTRKNPAALLALMWHYATNGKGEKTMVILPYKDRLLLMSRYLQQLVMESLGKKLDLDGNVVHQGIAVYGNKGSTDQHAYVQQLRDGVNDFFATFISVQEDVHRLGAGLDVTVENDFTSGDFLQGFQLGTRSALFEADRGSITITMKRVDPKSVGALIALYERAVGFYASLVHINAYHQPGVEAGKKAAASVLDLQQKLTGYLAANPDGLFTAEDLADAIGEPEAVETLHHLAEHMAANKRAVVKKGGKYQFLGAQVPAR